MPILTLTEKNAAPIMLFLPEGPGPFPLVCLTPLLGRLAFMEDLFFEKKIAGYFARKGLACAVMERPIFEYAPDQKPSQLQNYLDSSISKCRKALDILMTRPEIDASRVGSFGMSFGAIVNCLWAAEDKRLSCNVLALGGADIPEIFMSSQDPLMKSHRSTALKSTGLRPDELHSELRQIFTRDPLHFRHAGERFKEGTLLFLAKFDRVVKYTNGLKLKEILGNPETVVMPLGHYTAILAIPFLRSRATQFFKRKFFNYAPA